MIEGIKPIKPLKKNIYPHDMIFFDTESNLNPPINDFEAHSFKLGCAIYIRTDKNCNVEIEKTLLFDNIPAFWQFVDSCCKRDKKLYLYAHNAKYDLINLNGVEELRNLGFEVPYPIMNHAFILSANNQRKKLQCNDTFNYIRTSVKEMGKSVGIPKMEINFDTCTIDELSDYCKNDVIIIKEFMLRLIKTLHDNDLGSLGNTTASTAFKVYRHKFINTPIYYHRNNDVLKLEREAYKGGMVEVYKLYDLPRQKYYLVDVNSMYPYVMSERKLPVYPKTIVTNPKLKYLENHIKNDYVIADVLLKIDAKSMRRFGIKYDDKDDNSIKEKHGKRLLFPTGTFRTTLHQAELEYALKNNQILEVYYYVVYQSEYCLKGYADYFYQMKKTSTNKADYEISKLLMNSLYGRFGMRKYINDVLDYSNIPDMLDFNPSHYMDIAPNGKTSIVYKWGDRVFVHSYAVEDQHVNNTNIALAGSVTAYARMLLCDYIETAGVENVFYMDTDSLVLNEVGYNRLTQFIDEKKLGYLKVEMIFNSGRINAPKDYHFTQTKHLAIHGIQHIHKNKSLTHKKTSIIVNKRKRSKGIPVSAQSEDGYFIFWRFSTMKDYLRKGEFGRKQIKKKNSYHYHKGDINSDGFISGYNVQYDELKGNVIQ